MRRLLAIAAALTFLPISTGTAEAEPWPIAPHSETVISPTGWYGTSNTWCGVLYEGSYGTAYFAQSQAWVNYGGTCNAQWGRPANRLRARVRTFSPGFTLQESTGFKYNANNSSYAHAHLTYDSDSWHFTDAEALPFTTWVGGGDSHFVD